MAANPINVVLDFKAVQYDGTNSSDIAALISLNNSSGNTNPWTFKSPPDSADFSVPVNSYVTFSQGAAHAVFSPSEFAIYWKCYVACSEVTGFASDIEALEDAVEVLEAQVSVKAIGVAPVPLLLASGTATVAVQLQPAMPDAAYSAYASKFAGVSLTDLQINSVTVVDADTVNVAVENVGLITLTGATVMVHAVD